MSRVEFTISDAQEKPRQAPGLFVHGSGSRNEIVTSEVGMAVTQVTIMTTAAAISVAPNHLHCLFPRKMISPAMKGNAEIRTASRN